MKMYAEIYANSGRLTGRQPQQEKPDGYDDNKLIAGQWVCYSGASKAEILERWMDDIEADYPQN